MRKLNGITINGEYLGNSVVINGMFRAICTISPVIMRDFVHIINKIDKLDNAVKIRNFNCGFDCINIEFENTVSKGIASLYFKLKNGEPELTNCKLVIDNQEYSTFQDKITLPDKKNMTNPNGPETERQRKIRELRERKMEQQKKLVEEKRKKLEELKKRAAEQKSMSPEELREKKRQELLEKKKQELLAKKRQAAGITDKAENAAPENKAIQNTNAVRENSINQNNSPITEKTAAEKTGISQTGEETGVTAAAASGTQELADASSSVAKDETQTSTLNSATSTEASADAVSETASKTEPETSSEVPSASMTENGTENISGTDAEEQQSDTEVLNTVSEEINNTGNEIEENEEGMLNSVPDNIDELSDFDISENDLSQEDYTPNDYAQDNFDDISDEELAALEAELDSEMGSMSDAELGLSDEAALLDAELSKYTDSSQGFGSGSFNDFAKELKEGLSQGLSEGLSKGLSEGLCALFGSSPKAGFNNNSVGDFQDMPQGASNNGPIQYKQTGVDFGQIDDINNSAAMSARDSYSFDEDSDLDGLSDLYSDFYSDVAAAEEEPSGVEEEAKPANTQDENAQMSELDALKAELEALKAEAEPKKDLMSLDEFLEKQKELADAKEKKRRQKLRILGSKERINASALDNGMFVSGNKVYKWGETRVLDD